MSNFSHVERRTCEDTGHECALKSLQDQGLINQVQYDCLIKAEGFCVPGIGTNPSKILELLNGVPIKDAKGNTIKCMDSNSVSQQGLGINFRFPMESQAATYETPEKLWLRFDCSQIVIPVGISNIAEAILSVLFTNILTSTESKSASRLILNLGEGINGHYSVFYGGDNPYIIDPFDPNRNSYFRRITTIPFTNLQIDRYIYFLIGINELFQASSVLTREQLLYTNYGQGINVLDIDGCKRLEAYTMSKLTPSQLYSIANPGYLQIGGKRIKTRKKQKRTKTRKKQKIKN